MIGEMIAPSCWSPCPRPDHRARSGQHIEIGRDKGRRVDDAKARSSRACHARNGLHNWRADCPRQIHHIRLRAAQDRRRYQSLAEVTHASIAVHLSKALPVIGRNSPIDFRVRAPASNRNPHHVRRSCRCRHAAGSSRGSCDGRYHWRSTSATATGWRRRYRYRYRARPAPLRPTERIISISPNSSAMRCCSA